MILSDFISHGLLTHKCLGDFLILDSIGIQLHPCTAEDFIEKTMSPCGSGEVE